MGLYLLTYQGDDRLAGMAVTESTEFFGYTMHFTEEDAAVMYARACHAWYGRSAPRVVTKDEPGVRIWSRVAEHVSRLQRGGVPTTRRHHNLE